MIVRFKKGTTDNEFKTIVKELEKFGIDVKDASGSEYKAVGLIGDTSSIDIRDIEAYLSVDKVMRISEPFKLASRTLKKENTIVNVNGIEFGGKQFVVIAGPCSVENKDQIVEVASKVKESGAKLLRGGAFKPRTSPYSFQGLELDGLELLKEAREETGLPIVTEITSTKYLNEYIEDVDIIQIGARNMQNFELIKAVGKTNKPILLKRGMSATIEDWLMSAEYIMASGNPNVILCERGIRTFEKYTRNTLDLSAVLAVKQLSHLPVIVDPSHACGKWWMVEDLARASLAAGADGLIIEVHNDPEHALSDGVQSLKPEKFNQLMESLKQIAPVVNKEV